ncbi:MAG: RsmB/NOP family class I SAM-dependent RNA methyltransferase [Spirochaetales bacterium]|uniref:NOL1/NOP2/Sun domain family member 4 n=1 Tax=Candidatus Thalassospirochaeta sargassi TaxID=3119039 RepID=A0AAJ1MHZ2_9SPIO|nr:RsmB/NOP family class I SAM-dependent RNA methyltransferase [Spirochaetales bacterium]
MAQKKKQKQKPGFEDYYSEIYKERWDALKSGLLADADGYSISDGLLKPYYLDMASAAAARTLDVHPGDDVLDMCAAPGGKTLLLALALKGSGSLNSNDRSSDRRRRLKDVIENHLPTEVRENIRVTGHDATRWGLHEKDCYDRVLLDAPCSSEEHVLKSPAHLNRWSPSRTKQLSIQAHAMLAAAVDAVKPGGTILYSTCALSPLENDGVIAKLLKKRSDKVCIETISPDSENLSGLNAETTDYGLHILPDRNSGYGPIFMARLKKF